MVVIQITRRPPDNTPPVVVTTVGPVGETETWSKSVSCPAGNFTLRVWVVDKDPIVRDITVT
jgi:hypothetical protein